MAIDELLPPSDQEKMLASAIKLEKMSGQKRSVQIKHWKNVSLGSSDHNPLWVNFLAEIYSNGENQAGPSVINLLETAHKSGLRRDEAKKLLGRVCSYKSVQKAWGRWTMVNDREELRLRLEIISRFDRLDSVLHDFLTFFFRASDPTLYQTAAIAIGRHLKKEPFLSDYLQSYAEKQGINPEQPLFLNNKRSNRRLMLAWSVAVSSGYDRPESFPLHFDRQTETLLHNKSDLAIYLLALHALGMSKKPVEKAGDVAERILVQIAKQNEFNIDRITLRNWGMLLVQRAGLKDTSSKWVIETWMSLLQRLFREYDQLEQNSFAQRMWLLNQIDEIIRTAAFLPSAILTDLKKTLKKNLHEDELLFALLRLCTWQRREDGIQDTKLHKEAENLSEQAGYTLNLAWKAEQAISKRNSLNLDEDREIKLFKAILPPFQKQNQWLSQNEGNRALVAFFLLDITQYIRIAASELEAILTSHGITESKPLSETDNRPLRGRGKASFATFQILLRLISWEKSGSESFIDSRLLHQISDQRILLALLPHQRNSELLPALADAFEHQLRIRLTSEPDFQPEYFLYSLTIRKPHHLFFQHLKRVCTDRTYQYPNEQPVPILPLIERIGKESTDIKPGEYNTRQTSGNANNQENLSEITGFESFSSIIAKLRTDIRGLPDKKDLSDRLMALTEVIAPPASEQSGRPKGLTELLGRLNGLAQPLLQSGYPVFASQNYEQITVDINEIILNLRHLIHQLSPESIHDADAVPETIEQVKVILTDLNHKLVNCLPFYESYLLNNAMVSLNKDLTEWKDSFAALKNAWQIFDEQVLTNESLQHVFIKVSELDNPVQRKAMLTILWKSLLEQCRTRHSYAPEEKDTNPFFGDPWVQEKQLLKWAAGNRSEYHLSMDDQSLWMDLLTSSWTHLVDSAMNSGHESRLSGLIRDKSFKKLRNTVQAEPALEKIRWWFYDCYHLGDSILVNQQLKEIRGLSVLSLPRDLGAFFFHFSPLWLALLIGAILMLDFGDAWTSMAETGDVKGVALTFFIGLGGAFLYLFSDLNKKVGDAPGDQAWSNGLARLLRVSLFLAFCLAYTVLITTLLWFLLSGTDGVVHGSGAILHIIVWSGFALFVGIFFGLMANRA